MNNVSDRGGTVPHVLALTGELVHGDSPRSPRISLVLTVVINKWFFAL